MNAKAARKGFKKSNNRSCKVCRTIVDLDLNHAHHIYPLSIQVIDGIPEDLISHAVIFLCPSHHARIHKLINGYMSKQINNAQDDLVFYKKTYRKRALEALDQFIRVRNRTLEITRESRNINAIKEAESLLERLAIVSGSIEENECTDNEKKEWTAFFNKMINGAEYYLKIIN